MRPGFTTFTEMGGARPVVGDNPSEIIINPGRKAE